MGDIIVIFISYLGNIVAIFISYIGDIITIFISYLGNIIAIFISLGNFNEHFILIPRIFQWIFHS